MTGTCGGSLDDTTFTTNSITQDCTVVASFSADVPPVSSISMKGTETGVSLLFGASSFAGTDSVIYSASCDEDGSAVSGWSSKDVVPETTYLISGQADATISCSVTAQVASGGQTYSSTSASASAIVGDVVIPTFVVTPSAGTGGSISPSTPQTVEEGETITFYLGVDTNYDINDVGGSCGGTLTLNSWDQQSFTTDPVTSDCSVSATFNLRSGTVVPSAPSLSLTGFGETSAQLSIGSNGVGSDPITSYTTSCEIPSRARASQRTLNRSSAVALGTPSLGRRSGLPEGGPFGKADRSAGLIYNPNPQLRSLQTNDLVTFIAPDGVQYSVSVSKAELTQNQNLEVYGQDGDITIHAVISETGDFFGSIEAGAERFHAIIAAGQTLVYSSADDGIAQNPFLRDMDLERLAEQQTASSAELQVTETSSGTTIITVGVLYDNTIRDNVDYSAMVDLYVG